MTTPNTPPGRNGLLTWGLAVGGLGAIPASPGPAPIQGLGREERAHSASCNCQPHRTLPGPARLRPAATSPGERGGEVRGPCLGLPPPNQTLAASWTPSSGHAQSHPQDGGRGRTHARKARGRCRPNPRTRNHRLSGTPDFETSGPPRARAGSSSPRGRFSPLQL